MPDIEFLEVIDESYCWLKAMDFQFIHSSFIIVAVLKSFSSYFCTSVSLPNLF